MIDRVFDLLKSSAVTQGVISAIVLSVISYMLIAGRPVPGELWSIAGLVVGFFFGGKMGVEQGKQQTLVQQIKDQ
jgi:hypothetical protein